MKTSVSVIIPCFNEEDSVKGVLEELDGASKGLDCESEVIVVDDGSTDKSLEIIRSSGLASKVIHHRSNRGYGASIKEGIKAAKHDYVLIMDADGQHPAENIAILLEALEDYDMVVGARKQQGSHHWRMPGKAMVKLVSQVLVGMKIPDINCGFRLIRRTDALKYMHLCSDGFSFSTSSTLAFLSDHMAVKFVPIDIRPRQGGRSHIRLRTWFSTIMLILRIIGTFNPLKIFIPPAAVFFLAGTASFVHNVMHTNISEMTILLLVTSVLLFFFGLLADQMSLIRREIHKD
ncbi:glycosyltransferase family 2 protein [Verrucomicrobiota bacterium]